MIETLTFEDKQYPIFQAEGFASRFAIPYAQQVCKGKGVDVGCGSVEWCFPGADPVDFTVGYEFHAMNLPYLEYDYVFSSHLLEHLNQPWDALNHWWDCLKPGGVLFLYLPDVTSEKGNPYHLPWNNKKHKTVIEPQHIYLYMKNKGYENIFVSGTDLNSSFMVMGNKPKQ